MFFNIELFFLLSLLLLLSFVLVKGINSKSREAIISQFGGPFLALINNQIAGFTVFLGSLLMCLIAVFFNKRFFFFDFSFCNDNLILLTKLLALLSTLFVLNFSVSYLRSEAVLQSFEYFLLILLSLLGMFCLISSNDFLSLYITVEFQSLALYVLAAFKQNSLFSIEAGLKYFILGTFSSGLLLFGASLLYGFTGTLNFSELDLIFQFNTIFKDDYLFKLGLLFFFSALMFKFTAAPFHMWAPDVYHGAPTIVTFFFSVVPKIIFLGVFIRLMVLVFSSFELYFKFVFFLCGFLSLLLGSLASILQVKLKRLLAYSSVANVGYLLMALSCAQLEALTSSFLFFIIYLFTVSGIFAIILALRYWGNNMKLKSIFELMGVLNFNSAVAIIFVLNLFSLLGLPPLAGFFVKFYLFFSALGSEFYFFLYLSILASIFSAVIYLRLIRLVLFNKYNNVFFFKPILSDMSLLMALFVLVNLLMLIYPSEFFRSVYMIIINLFKTEFVATFVY